jgi:Rieske Fe-S protein
VSPERRSDPDPEARGRRGFLELALGASLTGLIGSVAYPVVRYLIPPEDAGDVDSSVVVGRAEEFAPDTGRVFRFGNKPGLLVRTSAGAFKAFEATCTHLACIVQYRPDLGLIWCACHNGKYDLDGTNIAGPPPRPLTELRVEVKDGMVHVSRQA